jgi:hypothetical protein
VRRSRGEYVFFLDADDLFLDAHVHACLSRLVPALNFGYARTQVMLADEVHPAWQISFSNTIPSVLCVRRASHNFIGGFPEDPVLATFGAEDVIYQGLLSEFLQGVMAPEKTVYYSRRPGNALDRQMPKFRQAPAIASALTSAESAALPAVQEVCRRCVEEIRRRKSAESAPHPV